MIISGSSYSQKKVLKTPGVKWNLSWHDEFDYEGIPDTAKWAVLDSKDQQVSKDMVTVKDGTMQISLKKVDGKWRCAHVNTAPSIIGRGASAVGGAHDRMLFAPPAGGRCRLEIKLRGENAKGGGAMIAGVANHAWLFSHPQKIAGDYNPPITAMRGEIDMIEHASPAGGRPWITSIHITEWPGLKWGEGGRDNRVKSSTFSHTPTTKGSFWDDTDWHTVVAEWGKDSVFVYFDGELITYRYTLTAPRDNERKDGWDPADKPEYTKVTDNKERRYTGNNITARYFAFDEKFPMGLNLSYFLHGVPGAPGAGIGPLANEPTDYDALPLTVYYDYIRFYTSEIKKTGK